ncbi:MAG: pyridoxal 5'-phosphate synthase glutaminase subunit PdxT [Acidobacteriaceae bacterium]|nr:pyridoxal 5'-phosphate synthase glutaminase subunit PdxT [Acidobacteriaceae bacterium]MBV9501557.1 pyridoxal 5'-phosphate synthase glutaminase subunit PdxT [Acidobacteriaceae bacterium]
MGKLKIGVLALQGDFEAHCKALERVSVQSSEIRTATDLEDLAGLILPGGESTTMLKLLERERLFEPLKQFGRWKPIFGTCAGAILLSREVVHPAQPSLGLMDLTIERNGYGRQIDSQVARIEVGNKTAEAVFIRAPIIRRVGSNVNVLATLDAAPVLVEEGKHLAATFHPELSGSERIHRYFAEKVQHQITCGASLH